ncbi:hypothetical protein D3C81_1711870 [compost metagenome]
MLLDELVVEHLADGLLHLKQRLHDALDRRRIATGLDLQVGRGDSGGTVGGHLDHILRVGKALQSPLAQRVQYHDRHLAPRDLVQRAHHPWVVGAGIVTDGNHQLARIEVVQRHRALAHADGAWQAHAGRLMAHVRAVREIVGTQRPSE